MISRRHFWGCALCAAGLPAAASTRVLGSGALPSGPRIVDVHAHIQIADYLNFLGVHGVRRPVLQRGVTAMPGLSPAADSDEAVDLRLRLMDEAGVRVQILSPTLQPYVLDAGVAAEAARRVNDAHASLMRRHPQRLSSFVTLPLPDLEASLTEMRRGLDDLGMAGVSVQTACLGTSIADERFEPLFAEMNRRATTLFLHPAVNGLLSPLINEWDLTAAAGPLLEDAVAALHLMAKGIPARYPDVKIIVAHLGGGLSTMIERLDNQLKQSIINLPEPPSTTARRLWYDTVSHGSVVALEAAATSFGVERLLPGSDFPVLLGFESYGRTFDYIREAQLGPGGAELILEHNTRALFHL